MDWKFEVRKGAGEYFLVENRQLVGWDAGLPACGVIVYHVDEGVTFSNKANADESHRLVDVVEADGSLAMNTYGYLGSAADVFPGSSGHVDFTDATSPAATFLRPVVGCGDARQRRLRRPDERQPLHPAAERLVRDGHRAHGHGTVTGGNNGASKEAGEPAVAANAGGASVWYRFRAPATGTLRLSTEGSTFNTLLGVYHGTSVAALQEVASNDDVNPTTGWSLLEAKVKRGVTYRIAIDGQNIGAGAGRGWRRSAARYWPANDGFRASHQLSGKKGKKVSSNTGAGRQARSPARSPARRPGRASGTSTSPSEPAG